MTVRADNPLQQYGYVRVYRYLVTELDHTAAYIYGVLEWLAQVSEDNDRPMSPSVEWIADASGTSKSTAQRSLSRLRKEGWIDWQKVTVQGGIINRYTLKHVVFDPEGLGQIEPTAEMGYGQSDSRGYGQNDSLVRIKGLARNPVGDSPLSPHDDSTPDEPTFDQLWALWPSGKKGPKMLASANWSKLSVDDRRLAVAAMPGWLACEKWQRGYVRECHRWLRYREFDGEVPGGVVAHTGNGKLAETQSLQRTMRYLDQQAAGGVAPPGSPLSPAPQQEGINR